MRRDAILKSGALLIVFRLAGVGARFLLQSEAPLRERLMLFLPAAAAQTGTLLLVVSAFLAAAGRWPRARRAIAITAVIGFAILMIAGQADLTVSAITGAPLTPTVFRTYRGLHVVKSKEFLEPLRANAGMMLLGTSAFLAVVGWMVASIRRDQRSLAAPLRIAVGGGALIATSALVPWPVPPAPVEVAFAREYLHLDNVRLRGSESDAIAGLRADVGLPKDASWESDAYPLVYRPAPTPRAAARRANLPDIVVVMVESLRAGELAFVTGARESATPNLDALAARSVVFPAYVSNAFPSAPSVFAFHCSAWPHRRKEIITDFATRAFDCLPDRLASLGYDTTYVGADPHFDNQDVWLGRWYAHVVDLVAQGVPGTDRNIVSRAIDEWRRHDASAPERPLFQFVSTYSTHYPFSLPADAGETPGPPAEDLRPQYRQTLRYTDRELGRLFDFIERRPRRTVTIVVGDHGFYVDLKRISGVPENDNVWTAALVSGPPDLVGPPRRLVIPASHVDMMPTVLAMVGDERMTASLGSDLLGAPRTPARSALAIRSGGVRLDRAGASAIVDARAPNVMTMRVAFPGLISGSMPIAADVSAAALTDWVDAWSYLIERNRVWSDQFIRSNSSPTSR